MMARLLAAASFRLVTAHGGASAANEDGAQMRRLVMNAFLPTELSQALPAVKEIIRTKVPADQLHLTMIISDAWKPMEIDSLKKEFRTAGCGEDDACVDAHLHVASLPKNLYDEELFKEWVEMLIHSDWQDPATLHAHAFWRAFHPVEEGGTHPALADWFHSADVLPYLQEADYIVADIFSPVWNYAADFLPEIPRSVWMGNRELLASKFSKLEEHLVDPEDENFGPTAYVATISPFHEKFDVPMHPVEGGLELQDISTRMTIAKRELLCVSVDCDNVGQEGSRIALVNPMGSQVASSLAVGGAVAKTQDGAAPVVPVKLDGIMGELDRRVQLEPELQIVYFSFGSFDVRLTEAGLAQLLDKYLQGLWTAKEKYLVLLRLNVVHNDDSLVSDERIREILAPRNGLLWDGSNTDEANVIVARDYLPQRDMMQRFADRMVMVSHGGVGGVSDGIAMAVPVIVLPGTPEQLDNGVAIDEVGLGCTLPTLADEMLRDGGMKANGAHYNTEKAVSVVRSSEFLKNLRNQEHHGENLPTLPEAIAFWVTQRANGVFANTREALKTRMQKTALGASETALAFWTALEAGFAARQSAPAGEQASGASQTPRAASRRRSRRNSHHKLDQNIRQSALLWGSVFLLVSASICAFQVVRRNKRQDSSVDHTHVLPA